MMNFITLIKNVLANGFDINYRKHLISNFTEIEKAVNQLIKNTNDLKTDHENISKRMDKIEAIEKENAEKLDQQHLNMQQLVTILHDDFDVPVVWDVENIVKEKEV
ncbi:hypothetical protein [Pediococcus stilesii]|uniref:Uncharacterized protein n=1 Tax=Pediococcus stilesii TaxID=331679 RepID=A0A0R2KYX6_9LACO|nr:hypothetical protein [Pediococcus stilesii]KRN94593.1 hypothetical protein IV81_GL001230 [Pediococcus stilesii]